MNNYEKENAKEWQLDVTSPRRAGHDNEESDSDLDDGDSAPTAGLSQNRFAAIASTPLLPRPNRGPANQSTKRDPKANGRTVNRAPKAALKPMNQATEASLQPLMYHPPQLGRPVNAGGPPRAVAQVTNSSQRVPLSRTAKASLANGKEPAKPQAAAKITFTTQKDNAAKAAFRRGKPQNQTFTLPTTCEKIESNRAKMYARFEEIGVRFGSFVRPPQSLKDRMLLIWGDETQVADTINELRHWAALTEEDGKGALKTISTKSTRNTFGDVGELVEKREKAMDNKMKQAAIMQAYQKDPADDHLFKFQGYFMWPADEIKPGDLLGSSCEALDPIRIYNESHIVWEPQLSCFKILAHVEAGVQNAIERIEGTMKEYAARSSTTYAFNILYLPEASKMCEAIKRVAEPPLSGSDKASKIPVLAGDKLAEDTLTAFTMEREELIASNKRKMQKSLGKIIGRLPRFRGRLRMRVHFGTFTLGTIRWPGESPTIPYQDFLTNVTNTATKTGAVIRDLRYNETAEALIGQCTSSKGAFEVVNVAYDDVAAIVPVFTARFTFCSRETGDIRVTLEVELVKRTDGQSIYEISRTQWTRNDLVDTSLPYDVNVIRLTGGCSWSIKISHDTNLDETRITPRMADFASSIGYKAPPPEVRPEITGAKVFKHSFGLRYESFEQKTALRFQHKDHSAWIFEFARYDTFSPNVNTASEKVQWGASLWNTEWDNILAENDNLGIGQGAKWEPKFENFFPGDEQTVVLGIDGFQDFLHKVQNVSTLLDQMKGVA